MIFCSSILRVWLEQISWCKSFQFWERRVRSTNHLPPTEKCVIYSVQTIEIHCWILIHCLSEGRVPPNDGSSERLIRKKIKPEIFSLDLSLIRMNNNPCLKSEKSWDFIYFQFHFHSFEIVLVRSLVWWVERNFITVGFLGYSQISWTLRLISKVKLLDFRAKSYRATSMQYWQKFNSTVTFYFKH